MSLNECLRRDMKTFKIVFIKQSAFISLSTFEYPFTFAEDYLDFLHL
jgi:hypothetical protein